MCFPLDESPDRVIISLSLIAFAFYPKPYDSGVLICLNSNILRSMILQFMSVNNGVMCDLFRSTK